MSIQANNNLPPGIGDNHAIFFNSEEKECTECHGTGQTPEEIFDWEEGDVHISWDKCYVCEGLGTIPKTSEDLLEEREQKLEPKNL